MIVFKKIYIIYAGILLICAAAFFINNSPFGGQETDECPVMVKQLVYTGDSRISSVYVANSNNKKTIESISLADGDDSAECNIISQDSEVYMSCRITRLEWEVRPERNTSSETLDFSEIHVKWSDGQEETVDIGNITIVGNWNTDSIENIVSIDNSNDEDEGNSDIVMKADAKVCLKEIPYRDIIDGQVENLSICGKPLEYFDQNKWVELSKGDTFTLSGNILALKEYGIIDLEIPVEVEYIDSSESILVDAQIWKMSTNREFVQYVGNK